MFESVAPAILGSPIYRVRGAHWRFFAVAVHNARSPQQIRHRSLADFPVPIRPPYPLGSNHMKFLV